VRTEVLEVVLASDWDRSRQALGYNHKVRRTDRDKMLETA
jgi:hypothetical protein